MSCIKKDLIQKYIDGETSPAELIQVENHIAECEKCAARTDHQKRLAQRVRITLNRLSEETIHVPSIIMPAKPVKNRLITVRRFIQLAAAVCILLFIIIISQRKEPEKHAEIILTEPGFAPEFDANRPVSQQQIVITIINSEGNKSEYFE
jgi:predicted anti-sigma-YlaC factor YlaD